MPLLVSRQNYLQQPRSLLLEINLGKKTMGIDEGIPSHMHLSTCQFPSCNLFTQHVSYLLWRDTTSGLWTLVHSFTSEYTIYCKHCSLHFLQENIILHTIRLILCFQQASEIDNLIVMLGQSILVVLCVDYTLARRSLVLHRARFCHQHLRKHSHLLLG